jgi:predicted O-methyltransferase YrrM
MDEFLAKYKEGLDSGNRYLSVKVALELFKGQNIVETGTIRGKDDWGAGMSTLIFADFCKTYNHHLFTVDIDAAIMDISREITKDYAVYISYIVNDSVTFLKNFNQQIDFLYLDSMDCPEYDSPYSFALIASQIHQLKEIEAAWDKLSDGAVILLDDNKFENGGKTKLAKYFLRDKGCRELINDKQALWQKCNTVVEPN